jgi:hypothetical protein
MLDLGPSVTWSRWSCGEVDPHKGHEIAGIWAKIKLSGSHMLGKAKLP